MKKQLITVNLTEWESWLIALLCKRITYGDVASCAVDKAETEQMITVIEHIRKQLADQGIAPR